MTGTPGRLQWVATNSSGGSGKEGEVVGKPGVIGSLDFLEQTEVSVDGFISEYQQSRYPGGSLLQTTQPGQRAG